KLGDKGQELNTSIDFSKNRNTNDFNQIRHDYDANGILISTTPYDQQDSTKLSSYNVNGQIDYTHPLNETTKFETGYKSTVRVNDNSLQSDTMNYSLNNYVTDLTSSNQFKLSEYINAVYGTFSSAIGKNFTYKLGVRLEQTNS